jgi:hypothetical protein
MHCSINLLVIVLALLGTIKGLRLGLSMGMASSKLPLYAEESVMSAKAHGTSAGPVQPNLRWGCDRDTADRICSFNRHYAEFSGYWNSKTSFLDEVKEGDVTTFFDSVTGKPLFRAPVGRTFAEFKAESVSVALHAITAKK